MMKMQTTITIKNIIDQLGGSIMYTGGRRLAYSVSNHVRDGGLPSRASSVSADGYVTSDCYIQFDVNVKRGQVWRMFVHYEPDDTYTVRLHKTYSTNKMIETGKVGEVVGECKNVYCDQLQAIVKSVYDEAIKQFNGGFINL